MKWHLCLARILRIAVAGVAGASLSILERHPDKIMKEVRRTSQAKRQ